MINKLPPDDLPDDLQNSNLGYPGHTMFYDLNTAIKIKSGEMFLALR